MAPGESDEFTFNGSKCSITLQDEFLEIKTRLKDSKILSESPSFSVKIIPFFELISATVFDPRNSDEKPKPGLNIANKTKLPQIEMKTVKRSKDHKWKLIHVKLKSSNFKICEKWSKMLQKKISEFQNYRPKYLLIFVNPYGGTGSARSIYDKKVAPIFEEVGVETVVITTDHKHHAKDYVKENDLTAYDGIIAVGGDGMLNEVINGLLTKTQAEVGANIHATYRNPRNSPKYHRPPIRVGVIPAGSTDCVSYVTQGINDPETSALHIVLGDSHPVDVVSLHNSEGLFQQFSLSLTGYGYFGDMLRHSENFRWMGPPRYTLVGANVFLKNKSYSGEVHFLPADADSDPRASSFCRAPCSVCQDGLKDAKTPLFTPSTPGRSFKLSITDEEKEAGSPKQLPGLIRNRSISEGFTDLNGDEELNPNIISNFEKYQETTVTIEDSHEVFTNDSAIDSTDSTVSENPVKFTLSDDSTNNEDSSTCSDEQTNCSSRPSSLSIHSHNESPKKDVTEKWEVIKGDFMSINGVAMSCACERSPLGLSPYSHLSDGAIDLIVVKSCSRLEFLRYMMAHTGKGDRFDFPFVEVHRVKAFQFIPSRSTFLDTEYDETLPSPGSMTTENGESIHLSLPELRVKYKRRSNKSEKKKSTKLERKMKRSQSESYSSTNPVSTWNSDGEIIKEANMTVRVHRGLIILFSRGIENFDR